MCTVAATGTRVHREGDGKEIRTSNLVEMSVSNMCLYLGGLKEHFEHECSDLRRPMRGTEAN